MKRCLKWVSAICFVTLVFSISSFAKDKASPSVSRQLEEHRVAYRDTMKELVEIERARYLSGSDRLDDLVQARVGLAEAELQLATDARQRIAVLEELVTTTASAEKDSRERMKVGTGRIDDYVRSKAARIQAEIRLLEERQAQLKSR